MTTPFEVGKTYKNRRGQDVRVVCVDGPGGRYPVIAVRDDGVGLHTPSGAYYIDTPNHPRDLIPPAPPEPEMVEWVAFGPQSGGVRARVRIRVPIWTGFGGDYPVTLTLDNALSQWRKISDGGVPTDGSLVFVTGDETRWFNDVRVFRTPLPTALDAMWWLPCPEIKP